MTGYALLTGDWRRSPLRAVMWGGAAVVLLLPLAAMQLTAEVDWGLKDFATVALMLLAAGGAFEVAARASRSLAYRLAAAIGIGTAFMLILAGLAVGISDSPADGVFVGVLAVGVVGALIAGTGAKGLALAMTATAIAQALAATVALGAGLRPFLLAEGFAVLWLVSAWLFHRAAREPAA